ncbi:hypothetical protein HNR19_003892 [Nocardioides thalensis]|uniref:Lipoprotein n=1 Tax=Nocardioides thalensis TaxID=1914755 RepID=A0A853C6N3_9ACTN|nr:hypothetical protein [Nocardioides thalensis]NYJ03194.1 hypothetical protein [Nocardioides thalensis]
MVVRALVTLLFLLPALVGCDGGADPEPDVDAIVASVEDVPSVTKSVRLTDDTDPDKMLGSEEGYSEAAVFYDSRLKCPQPGIDCGAVLEVWADADGAKERSGYLKALQSGMQSLGTEYHYRDGALLLRVNGDLTAKQAEEYQAAFNEAA